MKRTLQKITSQQHLTYCNLITKLQICSNISRNISTRKSLQESNPDRLADLLDEAAETILNLLNNNETTN